jgi:hypothetical protein
MKNTVGNAAYGDVNRAGRGERVEKSQGARI